MPLKSLGVMLPSVQKFYFQEISHAEAGVKARAAPVERVAAIRKLWLFETGFWDSTRIRLRRTMCLKQCA